MELEQTGLRENPPGSVAVHKTENCEESLGDRIEDCGLQDCKGRAVDGESAKSEETEMCVHHQQQQQQQLHETDVHKKQPEEELDPRIQVPEK